MMRRRRLARRPSKVCKEFSNLGVDFISLNESIDTSSPMGRMVFTLIGAVAELERSLIRERVMMGLDRAKKQGRQLGRPRVEVDSARVAALRRLGRSWSEIATELGIGKGTAQRAVDGPENTALRQKDETGQGRCTL
jgi:DNA invertase Pin-like site-specific DNA recombinase